MTSPVTVAQVDAEAPIWLEATASATWMALAEVARTRHVLNAWTYLNWRFSCDFDLDATPVPGGVVQAVALLAFVDSTSALMPTTTGTSGGAVTAETKAVGSLRISRTYASGVTSSVRGRLGSVEAVLRNVALADGSTGVCRYAGSARRIEARS